MADSHDPHGEVDPNAAPMHTEVRAEFPVSAVLFCYLLAAIALIAGVVTGLTVIND
jgi:hypothetical protein